MTPAKRAELMKLWRQDVQTIVAGGFPRIPAPFDKAQEAEFIGRVIVRLVDRGWTTKECAFVWRISHYHAARLRHMALGRPRKDRT